MNQKLKKQVVKTLAVLFSSATLLITTNSLSSHAMFSKNNTTSEITRPYNENNPNYFRVIEIYIKYGLESDQLPSILRRYHEELGLNSFQSNDQLIAQFRELYENFIYSPDNNIVDTNSRPIIFIAMQCYTPENDGRCADVCEHFLKNGANANYVDSFTGNSLLHLAAEYHSYSLFSALLDFGATPYVKNNNDQTPLDVLKATNASPSEINDFIEPINKKFPNAITNSNNFTTTSILQNSLLTTNTTDNPAPQNTDTAYFNLLRATGEGCTDEIIDYLNKGTRVSTLVVLQAIISLSKNSITLDFFKNTILPHYTLDEINAPMSIFDRLITSSTSESIPELGIITLLDYIKNLYGVDIVRNYINKRHFLNHLARQQTWQPLYNLLSNYLNELDHPQDLNSSICSIQ